MPSNRQLMPRTYRFGREISLVMSSHWSFERNTRRDLNSGTGQAIQLERIVGEQEDPGAIQYLEHQCGCAIVALVIVKAQRRIGIAGIEPTILQFVGSHLVGKTEAAS